MSDPSKEEDEKRQVARIERTAKEEPTHIIHRGAPLIDPILTPDEETEREEWLKFEAWRVGLNDNE